MDTITHKMRKQKWMEIIQECNNSGMKKKDWLKMHGVSEKNFYRWQQIIRSELYEQIEEQKLLPAAVSLPEPPVKDPKFVQVSTDTFTKDPITLKCGDISVELNERTSDEMLTRIIRVMKNA